MKKIITLGSILLALSIAPFASAVGITGDIHIAAFGSTASINFLTNQVNFTPAAPGNNSQVAFSNGDYAGLLGTGVSYANFNYGAAPGVPVVTNSLPNNAIWYIDADTYFILDTVSSINEGTGLVLQGLGTAHHNGLDPTQGLWSFSASASGNEFSFATTTEVPPPPPTVPDGGTTIALLGLALAGLALARRK